MAESPDRPHNLLPRGDSRKKIDDVRRSRFKDRAKDLERGISTPSFFAGEQSPGHKAPLPLNAEEVITVGQGMGHNFMKKTFFQPTYCHHCSEMLWGIKGQGYMCQVCNYVSHEKCVPFLKTCCTHLMADALESPVAHKWTKSAHKKKCHCNVCRKKISGEHVICEVCKYYSHKYCKDQAFNNCKACATYAYGAPSKIAHHWIEGNLPSSAVCQVCTKSCCSTDCLTGFRCGWCGVAVHTRCLDVYQKTSPSCTFRDLWGMILLPSAISHRMVTADLDAYTPTSATDPCSPIGEDDEADCADDDGKGKPCIVVDGSSDKGFRRWRKTTLQPTYLSKKLTAQQLLVISLRKCGISDEPSDYYLAEMLDSQKELERELEADECPYNIHNKTHGIFRLYVRHRQAHKLPETEEVKGRMRICNGHLNSIIPQVSVLVNSTTTVSQIISKSLIKFDLEEEVSEDFCLVEMSQVAGVTEIVLDDKDTPWKGFQELRRNSLTFSNRQRYYLRNRKGSRTSVFIGGVAKEVLREKEKYDKYVRDFVSGDPEPIFHDVEIGPAFPTLGGMIVTFPCFDQAVKLSVMVEESANPPQVIVLPSIFTDALAVNQEPLLVFVNGKSGGNQGVELVSAFRRHLNPHQVWDLSKGGPIPALWSYRKLKQFRILIGGGDGTFGWVLGALQEMKEYLHCEEPPSALLPLGTGNDLARALKWGGGYNGEKVMHILLSLEDSNIVKLDRWNVILKERQLPKSEQPTSSSSTGPSNIVMNNYMGVGLDAAVALDFHLAREENPEKFNSRLHNKSYYLQLGLQKMVIKSETHELRRHVTLTVDGKRVDLPDIAGLIILNIQSWGAGADPWGVTSDPAYKPTAHDDGLLEVVGIKGVMQMGQVQSGIRNAVRIAQGSEFVIDILSDIPVQVDGEAWAQPPSVINISKCPDQAVMLQGPDKDKKLFSQAATKKTQSSQINLLRGVSNSGIEFNENFSSRRSRSGGMPLLTDEMDDDAQQD